MNVLSTMTLVSRQWTTHRWRVVAVALLVSFALVVGLIHTSIVRARVLSWAVSELRDSGIRAEVGRLDYNLFALTFGLEDATLTAEGSDTAFFATDAVTLDLPWSIVGGTLAVQSLEIDRPSIVIVRAEDGTLNLPEPAGANPEADAPPTGPLRIDRLVIRDLGLRYGDASMPLSVDGRGVSIDMRGGAGEALTGRISMSDGVTLQLGERETSVSTLEGGLGFDGTTVSMNALTLEAPEARLRLDGTIGLLAGEQRVDVRYEGRLDAERLAPWVGLDPAPSGQVVFSGTALGPLVEPDVSLDVSSDGLAWSTLGPLSFAARTAVSGPIVTLQSFVASLAGGQISGEARLQLDDAGPSSVRTKFQDLNLSTLGSLAPDLPVNLASIAEGEAALEWTGQDMATAAVKVSVTLRASPVRQRALALAGQIDLVLGQGAWTLSVDQRVADAIVLRGNASGRLESDRLDSSSLGGRVTLTVGSLPDALRRLDAAGLVASEPIAGRVRGGVSASFDLGGTLSAPRATGTLEATELWLYDTGPGLARVTFAATTREVTLDPVQLDVGPNAVSGRLVMGVATNSLDGSVVATLPQLAPLAVALPAEWRPEGSADLEAELGGTLDNPTVQLSLSSTDLRVAGQTLRTIQSKLQLANQVVTVEQLEFTQDAGRLRATGRYDIQTERFTFDASGDDFSIAPLILTEEPSADEPAATIPLDARFSLQLSGGGTLADPNATGFVQFTYLDWERYRLGAARADVVVEGRHARMVIGVPSVNATIRADAELDAPRSFTFEASAIEALLSELVRPTGPAGAIPSGETSGFDPALLAGMVTLRASGIGRLDALTDATVDLDLRLADVTVNGAPLRLERPARLRYAGRELVAEDLELHLGNSVLSARGALGSTTTAGAGLAVQITGSLADFLPFARLAPGAEAFEASGTVDLQVQAAGSLEMPDLTAEFTVGEGSFGNGTLPPVSAVAVRATYVEGLLEVQELRGGWLGASFEASGQVPAALLGEALPEAYRQALPDRGRTARMTARVTSVTQEVLTPFLDQATLDQIAGRFDAVIEMEADTLDLEGVRADVTLARAEMELARVPLSQTRPTRMHLEGGRFDVVEWNWSGAGNRLEVFGGVSLAGETPDLGLRVTGAFDLRLLGAFAPDIATAGRAILDVDASGPLDDPQIEGQITVGGGNIIVREPRFAITDLEGVVTLTGDRMQLREVTASANGGDLQISGEILYPDFELTGGTVVISGRGLAFEIPENLRTEVDADLEFTFAQAAPLLTGRVTILRGSYREPISLAGQLLTGVDAVAAAPAEAEPSFADRIQLGISVVSEEDILIDNNYGRLELGANLKVIGTLGQPALAGRLTMLEGGEVFLGGQTYQVTRGTVDFTNARRIEPNLDLALDTRVQNYDITLEVRGTPETLDVSLRSPGASQEDVVSLLLTGQVASGTTVAQTEIARGQLLMLLSGELLGFAGRAVGLDSAQVGRGLGGAASDFDLLGTNADPGARLTLTKNLSRDVQLVFSQSLRESGAITWIAIYRPLQGIEVRGTTEDDNSRAYSFRQELNFGGGVATRTGRAPRGPNEGVRVSEVRITGTPGFAEAELRDRIRLDVGDRFDFQNWQEDQDRLSAFFHERDFLEAQITARRRVEGQGDTGSVALEYDIERGPRTTLAVEGYTAPSPLVENMKVAWSRAVFDGFLLEDLEVMVKRTLVEQAYLQATVKAAVTSSPEGDIKQITIQVAPGARYDERRIAFAGNERVPIGALEALVQARGLDVSGWDDASDLESTLEQYYRSVGSLAVDVTVDAPVFSGRSATLTVRIDEGQPFQIASVTAQGVSGKSSAEVLDTFGIVAESPYLPSALEPARREVEVSYLEDGYNDARVSVTTLVDRERSRVDISLTVEEGQQQILAGVDIRGAQVTSRSTIERAVSLESGQPANLTDIYRAQKRLYDTGAFQSVDVTIEPVAGAAPGDGTQPVRASVNLQELPRYRFRYGIRLNDEVAPAEANRQVRPALVMDLLRRNLFGRAVLTGVAGQLEADRRLARGYVSLPQVFGLPVTSTLFLTGFRDEFTPGLVENKSEFTAEQRFRPASSMAVTYGYNFARSHVFLLDPDPVFPFDVTVNVARLTGTYAWDTRDDPSNAQRGWFHSSGLDYGPEALGSEFRFIRYLAQQYYFKTVRENVVLASGFRLGAARGFGQDLITSEKFFAGGGTTVRGFAESGLGPQDSVGALGGNGLVLLNQEVRFPVYKWLRGVGFFDAGNVFARAADVSLSNLDAGTGVGIRIDSPFALIRIDYGVPLSRRQEQPKGRWYFGIGQTF
jgi:outer membrane protein assembly complex protein YaeT